MLQLLFAVAFSAAPLTLYVPPIRSLNPFLEALEAFIREIAQYSLRAYPRLRLGIRRILAVAARVMSGTLVMCTQVGVAITSKVMDDRLRDYSLVTFNDIKITYRNNLLDKHQEHGPVLEGWRKAVFYTTN